MKLIELEILCKKFIETENEDSSYLNVLADLNIKSEEEDVEFKTFAVNKKVLEDEVLHICERTDYKNQSIVEFFDNRTFIVNLNYKELKKLLNDTV